MDIADKVFIIKDGKIKNEYSREEFLKIDSKTLNSLGIRDKIKNQIIIKEHHNSGKFQIRNLEFKFNGEENKLLINELNLNMGKIYGIIGKNGCGKSTFIQTLIGVERKSKEEIYIYDKRLFKKGRLKKSSIVMQDVNHQLFTDSVIKEVSIGIKNFNRKSRRNFKKLEIYII